VQVTLTHSSDILIPYDAKKRHFTDNNGFWPHIFNI
jgi:hypothetical protein